MSREMMVTGRLLTAERLRNSLNGNAVYRLAIERADGTGVLVADTRADSMAGPDVDNLRLAYGDRVTVTVTGAGLIRAIDRASP